VPDSTTTAAAAAAAAAAVRVVVLMSAAAAASSHLIHCNDLTIGFLHTPEPAEEIPVITKMQREKSHSRVSALSALLAAVKYEEIHAWLGARDNDIRDKPGHWWHTANVRLLDNRQLLDGPGPAESSKTG
jgi:hypothetical protein